MQTLQYRNKTADLQLRRAQARALSKVCRAHGAALIVNDHVDLALEIDADGVHVGKDDQAAATARRQLGHAKIVGVSCYDQLSLALAADRQDVDYVAFGSFFASAVKPGAVRAPISLLHEARQRVRLPVVAIGGITLANAPQLITAGVAAVAVISALFGVADVEAESRKFCALFQAKSA